MSRTLELPDPIFADLEEAAAEAGLTPAAWIAARLPTAAEDECRSNGQRPKQSIAERFPGRFGVIDTGGRARAAENIGERFAEHLAEQRRAGRL